MTNSSSSSFIICFARIEDDEKAAKVINKHKIKTLDVDGVNNRRDWYGQLGADWCGAIIYGADKVLSDNPNSRYVVITDSNEAYYNEDCKPEYDYDFSMNAAINEITEENGFADIEIAEGEGYDG